MTWIVYTLFNAAGDLLYVGQTTDIAARLYKHGSAKAWFFNVTKVRQFHVNTEREARDWERSIIAAELPPHNQVGTDICPRCRINPRARKGNAPYCLPCQRNYQIERKREKGWTPRKPPTVTCPRCGGFKAVGRAYCRPCKKEINKIYREQGRA